MGYGGGEGGGVEGIGVGGGEGSRSCVAVQRGLSTGAALFAPSPGLCFISAAAWCPCGLSPCHLPVIVDEVSPA